jgi:DAACS family dicarboxylate/amino acid:cation (Na+ or H+) symporter
MGLVLGAACGCLCNVLFAENNTLPDWLKTVVYVMDIVGFVFLRLLFITVIPLVFASLAVGVTQLGGVGNVGRTGLKTIAFFLVAAGIGAAIGLVLVNAVNPGAQITPEKKEELKKRFAPDAEKKGKPADFTVKVFLDELLPKNPVKAAVDLNMLGIITFSLLCGLGITTLPEDKRKLATTAMETMADLMVYIITLAMQLAPYGVFGLIFAVTAQFGFDLLKSLSVYVIVVLVGLAIQGFVVFPILVKTLGGMNPIVFFRKIRVSMVTAFSTSSSNATLPTNIRVAQEELGVPPRIAGFVLPLGATMCMAGTALFEGVTVMFLAQVSGLQLGLAEQLVVVVLCVLTAVGAAGVPGGSIPLLAMVLQGRGIDPSYLAIVLGLDRILDMCRTTVNNIGDLSAAVIVAGKDRDTRKDTQTT